ncbi:MAG: hypothetical protein Q9177_005749 [Variospora cf. flavescens]
MAVVVEAIVAAAGGDEYAADMLDQERMVDAAAVASTPPAFTSALRDLNTALLAMATAGVEALEVALTEAEVEDISAEDSAHTFVILGSMEIAMREDEGMDPLDESWDGVVDDMEATKTGREVDVEVELCVPVDECADEAMDMLDMLDDIEEPVFIEELDDDDDEPIATAITEEVKEELIDTAAMGFIPELAVALLMGCRVLIMALELLDKTPPAAILLLLEPVPDEEIADIVFVIALVADVVNPRLNVCAADTDLEDEEEDEDGTGSGTS